MTNKRSAFGPRWTGSGAGTRPRPDADFLPSGTRGRDEGRQMRGSGSNGSETTDTSPRRTLPGGDYLLGNNI